MQPSRHIQIIDDHLLFMQSMSDSMYKRNLARKISISSTCEDGLGILKRNPSQLVFLDVTFRNSEMQGFECLKQIKDIDDSIKILMLSAANNFSFITKALGMKADGYINKGASIDELVNAIKTVESGNIYIDNEDASERICKYYGTTEIFGKKIISDREIQVLDLISRGYKSCEIAESLFVSKDTIDSHRKNIVEKLKAKNGYHAIRIGFELGLLNTELYN